MGLLYLFTFSFLLLFLGVNFISLYHSIFPIFRAALLLALRLMWQYITNNIELLLLVAVAVVQSGPLAKRLPSVSTHEAFSRCKAIPFIFRGGKDSKQLVVTTGSRVSRHRHSKTCDAIQVPRFCW
jgi:hypothetical protein